MPVVYVPSSMVSVSLLATTAVVLVIIPFSVDVFVSGVSVWKRMKKKNDFTCNVRMIKVNIFSYIGLWLNSFRLKNVFLLMQIRLGSFCYCCCASILEFAILLAIRTVWMIHTVAIYLCQLIYNIRR